VKTLVALLQALALLAAAVVADGLLGGAAGAGRLVDPFLLVAVWFALTRSPIEGLVVGAMAGLAQDCLGSLVFGTGLLSKVVVAWAVGLVARRLPVGALPTFALACGGAVLIETTVLGLTGLVLGQSLGGRGLGGLVLAVLANAAVGAGVFALAWSRRRGTRRGSHALGGA